MRGPLHCGSEQPRYGISTITLSNELGNVCFNECACVRASKAEHVSVAERMSEAEHVKEAERVNEASSA